MTLVGLHEAPKDPSFALDSRLGDAYICPMPNSPQRTADEYIVNDLVNRSSTRHTDPAEAGKALAATNGHGSLHVIVDGKRLSVVSSDLVAPVYRAMGLWK